MGICADTNMVIYTIGISYKTEAIEGKTYHMKIITVQKALKN